MAGPPSAVCVSCSQTFSLDIVLSNLDEYSKNLFIRNHANTFQCKACFGSVATEVSCRQHLFCLKQSFTQQNESCFKHLHKVAERMKLLMTAYNFFTNLPTPTETHFHKWPFPVDHNALNYLAAFGDDRHTSHTVFEVNKDGDCLFNTVSLALWKTEGHSKELRLRTALEIITQRSRYDLPRTQGTADALNQSFSLFETYLNFVGDSLIVACYMTPSHIAALANAISVPLQLSVPVTPADSKIVDHLSVQMNRHISLSSDGELEAFCRGWSIHTTTGDTVALGQSHADVCNFLQNHFCLMVSLSELRDPQASPSNDYESDHELVSGKADESDDEGLSVHPEESDDEVLSGGNDYMNCDHMLDLPLGKPLKATQMLHELLNVDASKIEPDIVKFNVNMVGKYYFRKQPSCTVVEDNFNNFLPTPYTNRFSKKRAYVVQHGKYVELKKNGEDYYTFNNGLPLSKELTDSRLFLYSYRVSYAKLARVVASLTDSAWNYSGLVLIMYPSEAGRQFFSPSLQSGHSLSAFNIGNTSLHGLLLDRDSDSEASSVNSSPVKVLNKSQFLSTSSPSHSVCSTADASPVKIANVSPPKTTHRSMAQIKVQSNLSPSNSLPSSISATASKTGNLSIISPPTDSSANVSPPNTTPRSTVQIKVKSNLSTSNSLTSSISATASKTGNLSNISTPTDSNAIKGTVKFSFLPPLNAYDAIISGALAFVSEVPVGPKNNVRFVVSGHYSRCKKTGNHIYVDDVFVQSIGRTKTVYYLMPYRVLLTKCGDTYHAAKGVAGITDGHIWKITRRTSSLACGLGRCVTTIVDTRNPETVHPVLWEYIGEGVNAIHPNKLRTHPNTIAAILPVLKHVDPKITYRANIVSGSSAFRDTEQLSNAKRRAKNKDIEAAGGCANSVFAEQVNAMLTGQATNELPVHTAVCLPGQPFAFHLAHDYVFTDIGRFCMSDKALQKPLAQTKRDNRVRKLCALGIDKTYNLTSCHVTTTVYQNLSLVHNKTANRGKNPYFLGPCLIHQASTEEVFRRFLTDIDIQLVSNGYLANIGPQVVVCDGELAIRNAVRAVWPQASVYHCHQHLKVNLKWHLKNGKNGHFLRKDARSLLEENVFFRTESLGDKKTVAAFNDRKYGVLESVGNADPDDDSGTQAYLDETLFPKMIENIQIMEKYPDMNLHRLTNNPTESLNHELKRRNGFQAKSLTEFTKTLKTQEYEFRTNETFRAVLQTGDYRLSSYFDLEFSDTKTKAWYNYVSQQITDEDKKNKFFAKLKKTSLPLNHELTTDGGFARSTTADGSLVTLVPTARAAKKPCKRQSNTAEAKSAPPKIVPMGKRQSNTDAAESAPPKIVPANAAKKRQSKTAANKRQAQSAAPKIVPRWKRQSKTAEAKSAAPKVVPRWKRQANTAEAESAPPKKRPRKN